jgi:patatin-like phospholipase/acyl hydrolase
MPKYRILSLDGGGIRGIITAVLLQRLSGQPTLSGWLNSVDLIAGTSTGGLLSLALAAGLDPKEIRELYETKGKQIFDDSWLDDLVDLSKLRGADYGIKNLRNELHKILGDRTLAQLRKRVLITAFDLDNEAADPADRTWKPKIFHNFPGSDSDGAEPAYKIGVYTSAAPTYFPSEDGYIDGGVFASNPSMCALAQSQDDRIPSPPALSDVVLLSLGTGTTLQYIKGKTLDWGYVQWVKPLVSLMLDGVSGIADYQCRQILKDRYCRLAPTFPPGTSIPMDAVDKIPSMVRFAGSVDLTATVRWIESRWMR